MAEEGSWVDVAPLHEPREKRERRDKSEKKGGKKGSFEAGVGLSGYERGTGDEVVRDPSFKRPGEKEPVARDLFD